MTIAKYITDLIGNTPLLELSNYARKNDLKAVILGKLEYFNPSGSCKDRIAAAMLDDAEKKGIIKPGAVLVEPTSGNTGIGLAMIAAARGYRLILTMPETMNIERRKLLMAYGTEIVLTEGSKGMKGAIEKSEQLLANTPNSWSPRQFDNPANPEVHRRTTGPEIWRDTNGTIDYFVCGVGTGGTITGTGEFLKSKNSGLKIIAVEPADSPRLSEGTSGTHRIQGIGAGFIPKVLNTEIYNEAIAVEDGNAFATAKMLAKTEGLLTGISSGAALWAATQIALRPSAAGKTIVVILPDTGERYLSTSLFSVTS
jgi:cysteine synthase A